MRQNWGMKRMLAGMLALVLMLSCGIAAAAGGQLTVILGKDGENRFELKGTEFKLYQVGDLDDETGKITMFDSFKDIDVYDTKTALTQIQNIVKWMKADHYSRTDRHGVAVFGNLAPGIYYGEVTTPPENVKVQPFLVAVPSFDSKAGKYKYEVTVYPKYEYTPPTDEPPPPGDDDEPHNLTIIYIYTDGSTAAPTHTETGLWPGTDYDVPSPVIPGYTASIIRVVGTMPNHDMFYVVIYVPEDSILIDDYDTPLGVDNIQIHVGVCYE